MSQSNERKATPREVKKPLATVPPPAIYILSNSPRSLKIQVELTSLTSLTSVSTSMLLDSGATDMFINQSFVQKHQLETTLLPQPVLMHNVDGSPNENRSVTEEVHITLCFGCHSGRAHLVVANLRQQMVIIGHSSSGNDVWSSLRLRELRKLLEAQRAMRASRAYGEVIVSAIARCH